MAANTRGRLRRLAEVRPERGRVLSVFLNLDPSEFAVGPARATEIHSVLNDATRRVEQVEALDHDAKQALREDLERVRATLEASDIADGGTQGVAVYACSPAGLFEVIRLPAPDRDARRGRVPARDRAAGGARGERPVGGAARQPPDREDLLGHRWSAWRRPTA